MSGSNDKMRRQPMPEQEPEERVGNFDEVPLGYTPQQAVAEASRCLQCKNPQCVEGCPVRVAIPEFIGLVRDGRFSEAAQRIAETNILPAVCGRVCPQEDQCEQECILGRKGEPIAIGRLERFVADWAREHGSVQEFDVVEGTGKRVAIVGSGPAGVTCAAELAREGHDVTVFEALHEMGGVLMYGIPQFRLPKGIVRDEIETLKEMGVELRKNAVIGKLITIEELLEEKGYDAVFIGTGAGLPRFLGIEGENLLCIYSANEFLTRSNLMRAYEYGEADTPIICRGRVMVVGGGNVAMDSARTALRLGAEEVFVSYRRSREEMPARDEEIEHAHEEGIKFEFLTQPVRLNGDEDGYVRSVMLEEMELGEPDDSGRRRPIAIEGSEYEEPVDVAIIAIGAGANPVATGSTPDLELNDRGYIDAEEETGETSMDGVFAGGDIVTGAATVIEAMGAGRRAAQSIDEFLSSE